MKFKILLLALLLSALNSCSKGNSSSSDMYLGGLIVNPTSKFVVLLKQNVVVDTFYLNHQNKFGGRLHQGETGLYVFKHPPENQIVYLEPGDSTLILLNTVDFDESLNFSGKGAEKSNYLNKMYLLNQENNDLILSYFKLEPKEFALKTDSILNSRKEQLEKLNKKHKFSRDFLSVANASINYEYYDLRERYAYLLRAFNREYVSKIPEDFHSYRDQISFNDKKLEDYYVYQNLLDDLIRTKSLEYCEVHNTADHNCNNIFDYENVRQRMIFTDSLVQIPRIKNSFIERLAAQGIIFSNSKEEIDSVLKLLLEEVDYDGNRLKEIKQLAGISAGILPGNSIGELKLVSYNDQILQLGEISRKPIITYHWSVTSQSHYKWQHKIIQDLRTKFPEVEFIGINIDGADKTDDWKSAIQYNSYLKENEYQLNNVQIDEALLKNYLNRMIFVDPSGKIVKGDTRIDTPSFETEIEEFVISRW